MDEKEKEGSWVAMEDSILAKFLVVNSACVCLECKMCKWDVPPFAPFSGQVLLACSTPRQGGEKKKCLKLSQVQSLTISRPEKLLNW